MVAPQLAEFAGYAEPMAWTRRLHAQHGTRLIETTWAGVMFDDGLEQLAAELTSRGVELDWNPDRPVGNVRPRQHDDLARLVRTFSRTPCLRRGSSIACRRVISVLPGSAPS